MNFVLKNFQNNSSNPPAFLDYSNNEKTQIEIRRQVNILKELKNSDHIIRFFGVSQEDSKYYLVTEWMEHGNLHEYYTKFRDNINLETKIKFALDICRGVAYLHECKVRSFLLLLLLSYKILFTIYLFFFLRVFIMIFGKYFS